MSAPFLRPETGSSTPPRSTASSPTRRGERAHAATDEDWELIAESYAESDGDLDPVALGETGVGRVHDFDGTAFDVGVLRGFLGLLLVDPALADRVADATAGAGGPQAPTPMIAEGLRRAASGVLHASEEDWNKVAGLLVAQVREIDAEGRLSAGIPQLVPKYWEIWNEENYGENGNKDKEVDPLEYGDVLREAREALHEKTPRPKSSSAGC